MTNYESITNHSVVQPVILPWSFSLALPLVLTGIEGHHICQLVGLELLYHRAVALENGELASTSFASDDCPFQPGRFRDPAQRQAIRGLDETPAIIKADIHVGGGRLILKQRIVDEMHDE